MSLSARERVGCWRLLGLLDTADLYSLADTVTQKKGAGLRSREGAINAILQHSQSAMELLNRRKVYRDTISQYLSNEGVFVQKQSTKSDLVQKAIIHWREPVFKLSTNNPQQNDSKVWRAPPPTLDYLGISSRRNFIPPTEPFLSPSIPQRHKVFDTDSSSSLSLCVSKLSTHNTQENDSKVWRAKLDSLDVPSRLNSFRATKPLLRTSIPKQPEVSDTHLSSSLSYHVSKLSIHTSQEDDSRVWRATPPILDSVVYVSHTVPSSQTTACPPRGDPDGGSSPHGISKREKAAPQKSLTSSVPEMKEEITIPVWPLDCEMFGKEFCKWFYPLLNSQNPSLQKEKGDWGPQHFLEDAVLELRYNLKKGEYNGAKSASSCLLALTQDNRLYFQPSFKYGEIKCVNLPQGLVEVSVVGTVFRDKLYLGTFDQIFILIGNLYLKKWKIKHVDLNILKENPYHH